MAPKSRVYMEFSIADQPAGRVVFELDVDKVPKTAENFRALCTGEKGVSASSGIPLSYKGSGIHRIIDGFMLQGGDFTNGTGGGGESIWGKAFEDEDLSGTVDREGLLVMANRGPNTNGSQWFVTLAQAEHLNGKHVIFGRVVSGLPLIQQLGKLPTGDKDRPLSRVMIQNCGELELRKKPAAPAPVLRSHSRSRSRSVDSEDSEDERRKRKKARKEEKRAKKDRERAERGVSEGHVETLDELDARLEKEENERLEKERLEKIERLKRELAASKAARVGKDGIVYKGRGQMRYLDPEQAAKHGNRLQAYARPLAERLGPKRRNYNRSSRSPERTGADSRDWRKSVQEQARPAFRKAVGVRSPSAEPGPEPEPAARQEEQAVDEKRREERGERDEREISMEMDDED